tara:strand:+ start:538 stop:1188 length:651 start_codon:yes stop_codon:yes gene_type:complete
MTPERFQKIKDILNKRQPDLTVVLDNVHKPHNLAAIIRSCDAIGISDIHGISSNEQKVGVNLKSASGSNHWVNLHIHHSMPNVISELKQSGFSIYAANDSAKAIDYRKVDYTKPSVIVLGAELDGILPETLDMVDEEIKIPIQGMVESLNVSVANAVILFEAQRQRLQVGLYEKCRLDKNTVEKLLFEFSYPEAAKVYQSKGDPYPELDTEGQIIF